MTSKTQNCCDKFIIHKKMEIFLILFKHLVFYFVIASFYQNDELFDNSIKLSRFMPILGLCADVSGRQVVNIDFHP